TADDYAIEAPLQAVPAFGPVLERCSHRCTVMADCREHQFMIPYRRLKADKDVQGAACRRWLIITSARLSSGRVRSKIVVRASCEVCGMKVEKVRNISSTELR